MGGNVLIIGEVHEVVDRILSRVTGTGITFDRTASCRYGFGRGVVDLVARAITTTLEGVVETNPVSDFVSQHLVGCVQCMFGSLKYMWLFTLFLPSTESPSPGRRS